MPYLSSASSVSSVAKLTYEHLLQLFEQAPSFMAVLVGPDHVFEMVNLTYLQLVGHRDVLGKPVSEALPEVEGQGFFELLYNVYRSGKPFVGRGARIELQRTPNGPVEETYVNFVYQPIFDDQGTVYGIFAEGNEVTDLFEAQAALAQKIVTLEQLDRQRQLRLELADALRSLSSEKEIETVSVHFFGREVGAETVALVEADRGC